MVATAEFGVIVRCPDCREGRHGDCTSPKCTCPDARKHRNRPGYAGRQSTNGAAVAPTRSNGSASAAANGTPPRPTEPPPAPASNGGKAKPHWELVRTDPPPDTPPRWKVTLIERARPFLEDIVAAGSRDWHRVAIYPTTGGAGLAAARLAKRYGAGEWEWTTRRNPDTGQSAIYVRWTGKGTVL